MRSLEISRRKSKLIIDRGGVWINRNRVRIQSFKIREGDELEIYYPENFIYSQINIEPKHIIYEDNYIIAINKEPGWYSQSVPWDFFSNVNFALKEYLSKRENKNIYLHILNRLDRDTSGIILFSKDKNLNKFLHNQFREGDIYKEYFAILCGRLDEEIEVNYRIKKSTNLKAIISTNGKFASTILKPIKTFEEFTLIKAIPKTGRFHQIRIHCAQIGFPILGDSKYGGKLEIKDLKLSYCLIHSGKLILRHPLSREEIVIEAPLSDYFKKVLSLLN